MRKIALEEHFLSPGFEDYWLPTMGGVDQKAVSGLNLASKDEVARLSAKVEELSARLPKNSSSTPV